MRATAGLGAAAVVVGVLAWALPSASGDAADALSVYSGRGIATPIGVVSRVPAESAGGVIYTESRLDIGKSRAIAAAETTGELAEAFLATTLTGYANPTLVNAQYPASDVYPPEATSVNSVSTGGATISRYHAVANDQPSAHAEAVGGAGDIPNLLHIGGGESHSYSEVRSDGSVVTNVASAVHDVRIGPDLAPLVTIGHMASTAQVVVPIGGKPVTSFNLQITGVLANGVPVTITQDGLTLGSAAAVPASSVLSLNQTLAMLDAQGISLRAVPVQKEVTDTSATVSGAALQLRTIVPPSLALPTDIGKDETLLLGEVSANATGRKRRPCQKASCRRWPSRPTRLARVGCRPICRRPAGCSARRSPPHPSAWAPAPSLRAARCRPKRRSPFRSATATSPPSACSTGTGCSSWPR